MNIEEFIAQQRNERLSDDRKERIFDVVSSQIYAERQRPYFLDRLLGYAKKGSYAFVACALAAIVFLPLMHQQKTRTQEWFQFGSLWQTVAASSIGRIVWVEGDFALYSNKTKRNWNEMLYDGDVLTLGTGSSLQFVIWSWTFWTVAGPARIRIERASNDEKKFSVHLIEWELMRIERASFNGEEVSIKADDIDVTTTPEEWIVDITIERKKDATAVVHNRWENDLKVTKKEYEKEIVIAKQHSVSIPVVETPVDKMVAQTVAKKPVIENTEDADEKVVIDSLATIHKNASKTQIITGSDLLEEIDHEEARDNLPINFFETDSEIVVTWSDLVEDILGEANVDDTDQQDTESLEASVEWHSDDLISDEEGTWTSLETATLIELVLGDEAARDRTYSQDETGDIIDSLPSLLEEKDSVGTGDTTMIAAEESESSLLTTTMTWDSEEAPLQQNVPTLASQEQIEEIGLHLERSFIVKDLRDLTLAYYLWDERAYTNILANLSQRLSLVAEIMHIDLPKKRSWHSLKTLIFDLQAILNASDRDTYISQLYQDRLLSIVTLIWYLMTSDGYGAYAWNEVTFDEIVDMTWIPRSIFIVD